MLQAPANTVSTVKTLGAVQGVIIPPPDIKAIVEKTASFTAKHGAQFEEKIKLKQAGDPKFEFLKPDNIYHQYYQQKIQDIKEGKTDGMVMIIL